jgi:hypothetical protein
MMWVGVHEPSGLLKKPLQLGSACAVEIPMDAAAPRTINMAAADAGFMVSPFSSLSDFEGYGCAVKSMRLPGLALRKGARGRRPPRNSSVRMSNSRSPRRLFTVIPGCAEGAGPESMVPLEHEGEWIPGSRLRAPRNNEVKLQIRLRIPRRDRSRPRR